MRIPLLVAALVLAQPVTAGAWMQDEGTGFLSFGGTVDETLRIDGTLYATYGLRPKLTLGLKVDADMTNGQMGEGSAYIFAQRPIPTGQRAFKLAYDIGLGSTFGPDAHGLLRAGLSYGRGITLWDKSGWVALDSAVEWTAGDDLITAKLDATIGLTLNDRFKVMIQMFHSHSATAQSTTISPSVIFSPRPEAANSYQLGIESENGVLAIKMGVWRTF